MNDHHDHDPDLIMTMVDTGLRAHHPQSRARLDGCTVCLGDLDRQWVAVDAARRAPHPRLDDVESMRLRRRLSGVLGHPRPAGSTTGTPDPARRALWGRIAAVAAAVLLVVAAFPALRMLDPGDDSADLGPVAGPGEADTGSTATDGDAPGADADQPETLAEPRAVDDAASEEAATGAGGDGDSATVTTGAAMDGTVAAWETDEAPADPPASDEHLAAAGSLQDLLETTAAAPDEETARERIGATTDAGGDDRCLPEGSAAIDGGTTGSYTLGRLSLPERSVGDAVVTVHTTPEGDTVVVAHDPDTCAVLELAR